jgi:hypothetical protein
MTPLVFMVPGAPVPCARARVTRRGTFTPPRTARYEQRVAFVARAAVARAGWAEARIRIEQAKLRVADANAAVDAVEKELVRMSKGGA